MNEMYTDPMAERPPGGPHTDQHPEVLPNLHHLMCEPGCSTTHMAEYGPHHSYTFPLAC